MSIRLSVLGSGVAIACAVAGMAGCELSDRGGAGYDRPQPVYESQAQPVYQAAPPPPVYQGQPQGAVVVTGHPGPVVVYGDQDRARVPFHYAMERLRQADAASEAGDMEGARRPLQDARDALRGAPRYDRSQDTLDQVNNALDAINHKRARIAHDHIEKALAALQEPARRYEASER